MKKIIWLMGPYDYESTGIGKYSEMFISELKKIHKIEIITIPAKPKTVKRYIYQLFINPLKLIFKQSDYIILYEEGLLHMVPFLIFFRKKVIIIYHHIPNDNVISSRIMSIKNHCLKFLTLYFLPKVNKIIVPSNETKNNLISLLKIEQNKIYTIYNPFLEHNVEDTIDKKSFLKKYDIDYNGELILLNIGSEEDRKNFTILLDSMLSDKLFIKKIILIKIGKAFVFENRLKNINIVNSNNLPVFFLESISEEDLKRFYLISDIYISPSLHEGFGRTVIEAQLAGLPVIASNIPIYKEILQDSAYFINEPKEIESWVTLFKKMKNEKTFFKKYITKGRENSKRFLLNNLINEWDFLGIKK